MKAKHTAVPWRAECWTSHAPRTVLVDDPGVVTGKRVVAECDSVDDAAFIVRACNAHGDLIEALQTIIAAAEKSSFQAVGLTYLRQVAGPALNKAAAA